MNKNSIPVVLAVVGAIIGGLFVPIDLDIFGVKYGNILQVMTPEPGFLGVGTFRPWEHISWGRYIPQIAGGAALGLIIGYLGIIANKSQK